MGECEYSTIYCVLALDECTIKKEEEEEEIAKPADCNTVFDIE